MASKSEAKREASLKAIDDKPAKFFRIVEHPLKAGDTFNGYQPEEIEVVGDRIVSRKLIDKPNLFEYAQTHIVDLMDPRNLVTPMAEDS